MSDLNVDFVFYFIVKITFLIVNVFLSYSSRKFDLKCSKLEHTFLTSVIAAGSKPE